MTLHQARSELGQSVRLMGLFALAQTLVVLLVFDWPLDEIALGAAIGAPLWGAGDWFWERKRSAPGRNDTILSPPAGASVEQEPRRNALWVWLALPVLAFGIAWCVSALDLGALFVPGQTLGYAASNLVGLIRVRRWERQDGRVLLLTTVDRDTELYAR
jgi:hypothetical protein